MRELDMIPIVLLHALAMTSAMWTEQRRDLERLGHLVLTPDQRTYGAAPSFDVVADDLAHELDRRGIGDVVLAGSSMGGYVAMTFLRRHPGRVRAFALLGTRAGADDGPTAAGRHAFADSILDPLRRTMIVSATVPKLVGATTRAERPELVARVGAIVETVPSEAIAWSQRAIAARPDSFDLLRAAGLPSVVIAGSEDELVPLAEAHRMAAALPRARLITVPAAGHLTPIEAPDAVTGALAELLERAGTAVGSSPC
jgi:pimeloyl-ACP methyl ester carboxylesterase